MKKIIVFDLNNSGHHWEYNKNVMLGLKETEIHYFSAFDENFSENISSYKSIKFINARYNGSYNRFVRNIRDAYALFRCYKYAKSNKINHIHLIHYDQLFLASIFLFVIKKLKPHYSFTATLHWLPNSNFKWFILKKALVSLFDKLIVHGEYIKQQIQSKTKICEKLYSIEYPMISNKILNYMTFKEKNQYPILLCFGATRYDKGIDLLIEALKELQLDYKLIIAGREDYFTEQYIKSKLEEYNLTDKVILDMDYITTEKMQNYFKVSNIVVLPYRKIFQGQSGPLTEGVSYNCIIIGPNDGQIGYTIEKYKIGITFKSEDINDLREKIKNVIINYRTLSQELHIFQESYKQLICVENFRDNYRKVLL